MKIIRFLTVSGLVMPCVALAAGENDFQIASQLLTAARRGDTQTVQMLINSGADINYTDKTGLSLVCTAVMNNDRRAIQVLQMYGADASKCDRQIKNYRQKNKKAQYGEEYDFFSGLSSSHILALSAVGVAAVIGGVVWLTDWFDADNNNDDKPSGGSHSGGGGGGGSSSAAVKLFTVPYGPAYLNSEGVVNTNYDITQNLSNWDSTSLSTLRKTDFDYMRLGYENNFYDDEINPFLQNYLLTMRGYYSFASGYMGQNTFREDSSKSYAPVKAAIENAQGRPVRVALITDNGINPAGSADSADGILYAISTSQDSSTPLVDKYLNNSLIDGVESENTGYDSSGSGSAFNPYANVNDSALAKIVAGWEGKRAATDGDLYGFVPNGQLAIYRTGGGTTWSVIENATDRAVVGTYFDADDNDVLSETDVVEIGTNTYNIVTALSQTTIALNPEITINGKTFDLSTNSKIFIGKCEDTENCTDIAIYVGTDGAWYINSSGGNDVDSVYLVDSGVVYNYKTKQTEQPYTNFSAIAAAAGKVYNVPGDTSATTVDLIANVSTLPASTKTNYLNVDYFTTMAVVSGATDLKSFYRDTVNSYYGGGEGGVAHSLFNGYSASLPMIIMPAGDRLYGYVTTDPDTGVSSISEYFLDDLSATFENYAPMIYGNNLKHDFMTVVAVNHSTGTSSASTITGYGTGTGSAYGPIVLSKWVDMDNSVAYSSRKCGIAGVGNSSANVDPWCFAASGPTAEMATASAAGAVASVKSAFSYMTNDQIFTLLALTADGPYLGSDTSGARFTTDTLATYLKTMYELPVSYNASTLSSSEYLAAFKDVFGYGLINIERAIKPGFSVYYYSEGNIVSASGNEFWGKLASSSTSSSSRASTVLSMTGRKSITTSFYDVIESVDGSLSLPRVWSNTIAMDNNSKHSLYMGDVLADFNVDSSNKIENKVGNITFNMSMSKREYNDNFNGLDNLKVSFSNENFDIDAQYQHYLTDGESRFSGRANGVLGLASNVISSGADYKIGKFSFGGRAFSGIISDETLLENDPVATSQIEPARLGFANGGSFDVKYNTEKFNLGISVGNMNENNTVLGMYSDGLLEIRGGNTVYFDSVATYSPLKDVKFSLRGTFADTTANAKGGIISSLSDIKSNSFVFGADIKGFSFTASMPLAVIDGKMGYEYAEYDVVENDGNYQIAINNPHTEYIDLSAVKREMRFATSYKTPLGEFTDAGVGFIYRVNPNNTDMFGNESILMFKVHHRLGI